MYFHFCSLICLVCKTSTFACHQTRWDNKRISMKAYSIPRDFYGLKNLNCNIRYICMTYDHVIIAYTTGILVYIINTCLNTRDIKFKVWYKFNILMQCNTRDPIFWRSLYCVRSKFWLCSTSINNFNRILFLQLKNHSDRISVVNILPCSF